MIENMLDNHKSEIVFADERFKQRKHIGDALLIKSSKGFVEEENFRSRRYGASDGDAFQLPERDLVS